MWTRVPSEWTPKGVTFEMRGHMTYGLGYPNIVGPGYVEPGTPWVDPQGRDLRNEGSHDLWNRVPQYRWIWVYGPGYPWMDPWGRLLWPDGSQAGLRYSLCHPEVTPFDLFGLYHFWVLVWTCRLNPKSIGLKHTSPKWYFFLCFWIAISVQSPAFSESKVQAQGPAIPECPGNRGWLQGIIAAVPGGSCRQNALLCQSDARYSRNFPVSGQLRDRSKAFVNCCSISPTLDKTNFPLP